ncbi:hypothetical protein JXA02_04085 [candidate division KSB1 bacterium]|nr:hypothetical protein [candidate division KSB1 bacterium]RQW09107.1 MAG: hypothetical protein EH222_04570 [candidate division KSB1 bacterium]
MLNVIRNILISLCCFGGQFAYSQVPVNKNSLISPCPSLFVFASKLQANRLAPTDGALIIGDNAPDETMTIAGDYALQGDLVIINQGVLNLLNADFSIDGDIYIAGTGKLIATGGNFAVAQEYIYEHNMQIIEQGSAAFANIAFTSSGQSWSIGLAGQAVYAMSDSKVTDGFITVGLLDQARAALSNSQTPGEFLCFGDNDVSFTNCNFLLFWFVAPESSLVDVRLPRDISDSRWSFPDSTQTALGISYHLSLENCTNAMWGLISMTGSNATFRNSDLRAVGLLFAADDSLQVTGITNESFHNDEVINLPDRTLHLIESQVQTWNFYVSAFSDVTISNCVFGEILTQGNGRASVLNSICDGTGGYVGAFDQSFMLIYGSYIKSQTIARNSSVLIGANASFVGTEINADENAVMLIANTQRTVEPKAYAAAVLFEIQLPPVFGSIDSEIPIYGAMRLLAGPDNHIQLTGYQVEFSNDPDRQLWRPTDGMHTEPVPEGLLATWNTTGLLPGDYGLRITF